MEMSGNQPRQQKWEDEELEKFLAVAKARRPSIWLATILGAELGQREAPRSAQGGSARAGPPGRLRDHRATLQDVQLQPSLRGDPLHRRDRRVALSGSPPDLRRKSGAGGLHATGNRRCHRSQDRYRTRHSRDLSAARQRHGGKCHREARSLAQRPQQAPPPRAGARGGSSRN